MDKIEDPKVLCKATVSLRSYFGNMPFPKRSVLYVIVKTVKLKKWTPGKTREYVAEPINPDQASRMFNIMLEKGYLEFSHLSKSPNNKVIKLGDKLYRIGELRLTECVGSSWYKNRMRKEKFITKEQHIDTRSCSAIQQIYSLFGTTPFSYKMVSATAKAASNLADDKTLDLNASERIAYKTMKRNLYGHDAGNFREVWQKLIRNGYITLHKIKTTDGYIKSTGLYKINVAYLKHCLASAV